MRMFMVVLVCLVLLALASPGLIQAQEKGPQVHQENPDTAKPAYSNLALLNYYAGALDLIMQFNTEEAEITFSKMPFASIPEALTASASLFNTSGINLSYSLAKLASMWEQGQSLASQYRLEEARNLYVQAKEMVPAMLRDLDRLGSSISDTAAYLKISSLPPEHKLQSTYQEIQARIDQIRHLPDQFQKMIEDLIGTELPDVPFELTGLTLALGAQSAFVGDVLSFEGLLSCDGKPLSGREITILLSKAPFLTAVTDEQGRYQGAMQLPYRYTPQLEIQALYHPQGDDQGIYLAAVSEELKVNLLYYEGRLTSISGGKAYPGKSTLVKGSFEYRLVNEEKMPSGIAFKEGTKDSGDLFSRPLELYLEDNLLSQFTAETSFSQMVDIGPEIEVGGYTVTLAGEAAGRLSPVTGSCLLQVTLAAIILDMQTPVIAWIPGSFTLSGSMHSELGALHGPEISIVGMDSSQAAEGRNDGGYFEVKVKAGMGWSLLGVRTLDMRINPQEPWNAPLTVKKDLFIINYVSLVILLAVLAALGLFLPRFLKKWYVALPRLPVQSPPRKKGKAPPAEALMKINQASSLEPSEMAEIISETPIGDDDEQVKILFHWFNQAVELVQKITGALFLPNQTWREFDRQISPKLGPLAAPFHELTLLVEKVLYSRYHSGKTDGEKTRSLVEGISKGRVDSRGNIK
jgi:hypothetical protein